MKIGILETGEPPAALVPDYGTYDTMTRRFLGASQDVRTFRVFDGVLPEPGHGCDAFAITGSACGVKDGLAWVDDLIAFLQGLPATTKLVGICFGHQVMAQAFGGDVTKAPQGWGLGIHRYDIVERCAWMDDVDLTAGARASIWGTASHQDQVVRLPPHCRVVGRSEFTPHAILAYQDRAAISVQFHPEFTPAFSRALFAARPSSIPGQAEAAIASLAAPNDNDRIARWVARFLAS